MTLHNEPPMRKRAFKAALALADKTVNEFVTEQGITKQHLYAVLAGERDSNRLVEAVDGFIAEHLSAQGA